MTKKVIYCERALHNKKKVYGYNTNFGVMNRSKQTSSFVYFGGWMSQIDKENDLRRNYSLFKVRLRNMLRKISLELFGELIDDSRTILTIDFPEDIKYMKNVSDVFVNIEMALFFRQTIDIDDLDINDKHTVLIELILEFIEDDTIFTFSPIQMRKQDKLV
jgi:hypothetical protein